MCETHIRKMIALSEYQFEHAVSSKDSIIGFLIHLNPPLHYKFVIGSYIISVNIAICNRQS